MSVYALCQLVSAPLLGKASDRFGRKPLLLASQVGSFLGFLLLARATPLWMVYLSRIIDGATAGNILLAQAYISDNIEAKDRTRFAPILGGVLIGQGQLTFWAWVAAAAALVGYLLARRSSALVPRAEQDRARTPAA